MSYASITWLLLAVCAVVLIAWDFVADYETGGDATISWQLWTAAKKRPIVAFVAGVLAGHLFWEMIP